MMYRLAYRNFGTHESLVVNHSVDIGTGQTGIRWYELRNPGSTPTVFQQGTYAPGTNSRWMGSIAMDKSGDILLGYSLSSTTVHPSIFVAGRVPGDPLGTLESEVLAVAGGGSQVQAGNNVNRWGDYSTMSLDPVDDCTFWYNDAGDDEENRPTPGQRIGARPGMYAPPAGLSAPPSMPAVSFRTKLYVTS
jgi:hypothetical protein